MNKRTNTFPGLSLIAAMTLIISCDALYEVPETSYLIKEGKHKSKVEGSLAGNGIRALKSEVLEFTARFDESAIYDLNGKDQADVNKLFGFSDCNSHHQDNSARFGWAYNLETSMMDIYAYVYNNGKRQIESLGSVAIHETAEYRLSINGSHFQFDFNGTSTMIERGGTCDVGLYYLLYPYFGGNNPAPHDIRIFIQESP